MREFFELPLFMLTLTVGVYLLGVLIYNRTKIRLLHPIFLSIILIILFLKVVGIEYETYTSGTQMIDFMLGVSVVALGYLLYEQVENLRGRVISILTSVVAGSVVGVVSVILIARWLGADPTIIASLQPKSVTTPVAISLSQNMGGIASLTSVMVIFTGVFGAVAGPFILDKLGIHNEVARGLALGASAHAIGTARALELGLVEGAVGGLAIGLMGVATALLLPLIGIIFG